MTAKYPVDVGDSEGIVDAVNYLLSGPSGLGQNFAGFSSYTPAWLTGNYRIPFTQKTIAALYVPAIPIDTCEMLDNRTIKVDFTSAGLTTPPFQLGNGLLINGNSVNYYNDIGAQIGVVQCTNTYAIIRSRTIDPLQPIGTGGTVGYSSTDTVSNSTDCNARVTVTGGTDRVFISAQLDQIVNYEAFGTDDLFVTVSIIRYIAEPNNDPTNPDYVFIPDETVASKTYSYPGLSAGTGTTGLIETVFTSVLDQPAPAYYWYILEVEYTTTDVTIEVTDAEFGLRSLSAQVVKQ